MTGRVAQAALAAALLATAPLDVEACAGCRNPSLATGGAAAGALAEGALRARASVTGTTIHVVHEAGCADVANCEEIPVQPLHHHDQRLLPVELRLEAEFGVTSALGVEAQVPFRMVRTTVEYTTPEGKAYEPLDEGVHHRDETIVGPADPWLLARLGTTVSRSWLAVRAGTSLPVGRTEEDPFELGDRGRRHQHIQLGSGAFHPIVIGEASTRLGSVELSSFVLAETPLYENRHGYRAPMRLHGGVTAGGALGGGFEGNLGPEIVHEGAERWGGRERQDGSLGRTELSASGSLVFTLDGTELGLRARVPVWRHIVVGDEPAGELSSPVTVSLSVGRTFGGPVRASGS